MQLPLLVDWGLPVNLVLLVLPSPYHQVDEEPSIRANTTVLLGNLAANLGETTCKKASTCLLPCPAPYSPPKLQSAASQHTPASPG